MRRSLWWMAALAATAAGAPAEAPTSVITSDRVRILDKGRAVEFEGRVRMTRGPDFLSADRVVTEEANTLARAWGNVYIKREGPGAGEVWEAWGERAVFDTRASSGTLWGDGRPARARRAEGSAASASTLRLEAETITLWELPSTASASSARSAARGLGGVYLRGEEPEAGRSTELWAREAAYDGTSGALALTGAFLPRPGAPVPREGVDRPFARQRQGPDLRELVGRRILYGLADRRLSAREDVSALLVFPAGSAAAEANRRRRKESGPVPER